jgi:site-specific recombinase XerD
MDANQRQQAFSREQHLVAADRQAPTLHVQQVQGVIDLYADNLRARHRADDYSADALKSAMRELRRFGAEFGQLDLTSCRQHDLTRFFGMNPQLKAPDTKKRVATTIVGCFKWAEEEELKAKSAERQRNGLRQADLFAGPEAE